MDFSGLPFVDNHAHPLTRSQPVSTEEFRAHFSEAHSPILARDHVGCAVHYRWAVRQLSAQLGVEPREEALVARRKAVPFPQYARDLAWSANLAYLLVDEGYPPPEQSYGASEMEQMLGVPVRRILRIETLVQNLIPRHTRLTGLVDAFDRELSDLRAKGYVALKSIAAYRTGLQIERVADAQAATALALVGKQVSGGAPLRLTSKPLVDYFVWHALRHAAAQAMPFQFHTGYGDPDLDLRLANPLHLRPLFEDSQVSGAPIVLLHESFPYTAEAAYLAAVYPNAYLDLAFSLPPLDRLLYRSVVATALGAAPASKLMCSSDGTCIPEHYWLGARRARLALADVLMAMAEAAELSTEECAELARMLLHDNAVHVYRLA